jgi:hypothetical protein
MWPSTTTRLRADSNKIILRWADSPAAPALELPVEIVDEENSDPVVRVPFEIGKETRVTLLGTGYMVNGIVRFCRAEKNAYLITISTQDISEDRQERPHFRDPGTLVVDDFLTEEEEAKILESLQRSTRGPARLSTVLRGFSRALRICLGGLLDSAKQHPIYLAPSIQWSVRGASQTIAGA